MMERMATEFIENRTYGEIRVGDSAGLTRTLRPEDIQLFAVMSGDVNPAHVDPQYAHSSMFHEVIAHGMWGGALISTVLGTEFPGPGTIYISQTLRFSRPVKVGDTITIKITCKQKFDHNKHMIFDCLCTNQDGLKVIAGEAEVLAPTEKIKRERYELPEVTISDRWGRYHRPLARANDMARAGDAEILVQGAVATHEFLLPVIESLRTDRRLSHVLYIDVPSYPRPIIISDMMVNIEPSLEDKVEIVRNAIDFAHIMGVPEPKVAILAGIDTVTPKMRATLDAAALCKMADRGQISGAVLDGPLGFDHAVSPSVHLKSAVAGRADILIAPDHEAGNMLAKQLEHLSDAVSGGVVLGGRVPIVLANRNDSIESRVASLVLALLVASQLQGTPLKMGRNP